MNGLDAATLLAQGKTLSLALDHFTYDEAQTWVNRLEPLVGPIDRVQRIGPNGAYLMLSKSAVVDPMDLVLQRIATDVAGC